MSEQGTSVEFKAHPRIEDTELPGYSYYTSALKNFRMIREDGKHIVFAENFFESNESGDVNYLDTEITKHKNLQIRKATQDEIRAAHYRKNPVQTLTNELRNDESLMERLRAEIRLEMQNSSENKLAGVGDGGAKPIVQQSSTGILERLKPQSTADLSGNSSASNTK